MPRPDVVEFLGDDGRALSDAGPVVAPRRRLPRYLGGAAAALVVAGGLTAALVTRSDHGASHSPHSVPLVRAAVPQLGTGPVVAVGVADNRLYVLRTDRVTISDASSLQPVATQAVDGAESDRLVLGGGYVWLVMQREGTATLQELNGRDLTTVRTVSVGADVLGVATYADRLYFTTRDGVYVVTGSSTRRVSQLEAAGPIAADAQRRRLFVTTTRPQRLVALTSEGELLASSPINIRNADVAVTGSTVWLTGNDPSGAIVRSVDTDTLQATDLDIETALGADASIVAVGTGSIWLRGGAASSAALWCRNAVPGPDGPSWRTPDRVASAEGRAFVTDGTSVYAFPLVAGCVG